MLNLPESALPAATMQRIILHWTAGSYDVSQLDLECYHFIVDRNGSVHAGRHTVKQNQAPIHGPYAAHALNCNGGSIGISLAAMGGATQGHSNGSWPITQTQANAFVELAATLCIKYSIPVTDKTVLAHGEIQKNLGITQRGKWDPLQLPWDMGKSPSEVGSWWRTQIAAKVRELSEPKPREVRVIVAGKSEKGYLIDGSARVPARWAIELFGGLIKAVMQGGSLGTVHADKGDLAAIFLDGTAYVSARSLSEMYSRPLTWNSRTFTVDFGQVTN